jgi:fumarylacetoacetate (FAA) hydrolase
MKIASLKSGRDGRLILVSRDGSRYAEARAAMTLQAALDEWARIEPLLQEEAAALERGRGPPVEITQLAAPLPRAYEWIDGSAYVNHILLVRKARGAESPPGIYTDPLIYQGGSGVLLAPTEDLRLPDASWGLDFESEVCVLLDDVPQGTTAKQAPAHIKLLLLANDVTYRNLVPTELAKGFGFFQSKPATAFSPFALTPDELGDAWHDGRLHLRLRTSLNGQLVGDPEAGPEMQFSFFELIAHIAKTRAFTAGTILGSGTVSNADRARGVSCLAEKRTLETLDGGKPLTPFLQMGDRVEIEMRAANGSSLFGRIAQTVTAAAR